LRDTYKYGSVELFPTDPFLFGNYKNEVRHVEEIWLCPALNNGSLKFRRLPRRPRQPALKNISNLKYSPNLFPQSCSG